MTYLKTQITDNQLSSCYVIPGLDLDKEKRKSMYIDFNPVVFSKIKEVAEKRFNIKFEEIVGRSKKAKPVFYRQLLIYFIRKNTLLSAKEIGKLFGNRDHSTILFSVNSIEDYISTDDTVRKYVYDFCVRLLDYLRE